jgi:hypothetical protein
VRLLFQPARPLLLTQITRERDASAAVSKSMKCDEIDPSGEAARRRLRKGREGVSFSLARSSQLIPDLQHPSVFQCAQRTFELAKGGEPL